MKTASKYNRRNPTNINALKLIKTQKELANISLKNKQKTEYIQNQINKHRYSVEDRQSRIVWQTVSYHARRTSTPVETTFRDCTRKTSKSYAESITKTINNLLDIKLEQFTQEELDLVLKKIKNRKAVELDEISQEVWTTRTFDDILLRHCNVVYNQNTIDGWTKRCVLPFPKKGNLGLAKNYRGITLTSTAANIYNAVVRNRIGPKLRTYFGRTKIALGEIEPRHHKFRQSVEF